MQPQQALGQDFNSINPTQLYQPNNQSYYILQNNYTPQQPVFQQDMNQANKFQRPRVQKNPIQQEDHQKINLDLQKTKICPIIKQGQQCPKGDRCQFAHAQEELRSKPNLAKTKMCTDYLKGHCENGDNCNFAHSELELRSTPNVYKTALCNNFMMGECKLGDVCRFAHGEAELRSKAPVTNGNNGMDFKAMQNGGQQQQQQQQQQQKKPGFGGGRYGTHKPFQNPGMEIQQQQQPQQQQGFMNPKDMMVYQNYMPMMMQGVNVNPQTGYMMNVPVDNFSAQPQQINQYQLPQEIDQTQQFSMQNLQLQMLQQQYNGMNLQTLGQQQAVNGQQVILGPQQQVIGVSAQGMK